ncbi:ExbD/TolR family protein [Acetobacter orleanensis]|uniref:Biopolymer transporter ExbD n=1 Tax=Acetobacter orleanensis TaxID=104099 RepID=A0A4Y3TKJ5_9PROT|nr:biopolymer transporter ExbD [Acetobacter orleanensis]KXV67202.1 biopolymer transporter ExbD [Acetobacter orleanensis]PCD79340.1 biopolymer transporter ExbD [Acetobacter orleanensis]GAN69769.1 TonB-dependent biopolymer transport protein ExbD/TolR [Acetobacter orleanensis JCM 7639]GBR23302.1 ExbD/TolR proton channel family protein [Acetobacter orleanensis NRIC 0473]GEB82452.1 biopolymer transporter ExbD [Acetobacter orleanensis]
MGMSVGDSGGEDDVVSAINTTPLVDVMLVLLIIFLITIPVATHTVKVTLPKDMNQPTQTMMSNVVLAVAQNGQAYWDEVPLKGRADLMDRLEKAAVQKPQPQIQIRGDVKSRYESVGKLIEACQEAGIYRIDFITERPKTN